MTLLQFVHVATCLNWKIDVNTDGIPCLAPQCHIFGIGDHVLRREQFEAAETSLTNLMTARSKSKKKRLLPLDDARVTDEWQKYCLEIRPDAAREERSELVRSVEQWMELFEADDEL